MSRDIRFRALPYGARDKPDIIRSKLFTVQSGLTTNAQYRSYISYSMECILRPSIACDSVDICSVASVMSMILFNSLLSD